MVRVAFAGDGAQWNANAARFSCRATANAGREQRITTRARLQIKTNEGHMTLTSCANDFVTQKLSAIMVRAASMVVLGRHWWNEPLELRDVDDTAGYDASLQQVQ